MQYPKLIDRKYIQLIFHPQLIPRGATWIQCYNTSKNNCCMSRDILNFPETIPAWRNFPRTFYFYHASGSGPPKFLPNNPFCLFSNSNNFTYLNEYSYPTVSSVGFSKWSQNQIDGSIKVQRFLLLPPYKPL